MLYEKEIDFILCITLNAKTDVNCVQFPHRSVSLPYNHYGSIDEWVIVIEKERKSTGPKFPNRMAPRIVIDYQIELCFTIENLYLPVAIMGSVRVIEATTPLFRKITIALHVQVR